MRVFADFHNGALYNSLIQLFEKRLGWELYRPIGFEWFDRGYWKIAEPYGNAQDTINQYLAINDKSWDAYSNLNGISAPKDNYIEDGIYYCYDPVHDNHHKAITWDKFQELKPDIVISSIPAHDYSFAQLISDLDYRPKHIAQIGNIGQSTHLRNILCSTNWQGAHPASNVVYYHQEFNLNIYKYIKPYNNSSITSLINVLPSTPDYPMYVDMKAKMPDWSFKSYGGSCDDGSLHSDHELAKAIHDTTFMWHLKATGDGFGHVIHQAFACGRPPIIKKSYYAGNLAEPLIKDGVTSITTDGKSIDQIESEIRKADVMKMSENAYKRFNEVVDYDGEEIKIREFMANLL